jgi:hypothetical protein
LVEERKAAADRLFVLLLQRSCREPQAPVRLRQPLEAAPGRWSARPASGRPGERLCFVRRHQEPRPWRARGGSGRGRTPTCGRRDTRGRRPLPTTVATFAPKSMSSIRRPASSARRMPESMNRRNIAMSRRARKSRYSHACLSARSSATTIPAASSAPSAKPRSRLRRTVTRRSVASPDSAYSRCSS